MKDKTKGGLKLWLVLWVVTPSILYFRNKVISGNLDDFFLGWFVMGVLGLIFWLITAIIGWFILKVVYNSISGGNEVQPKQAAIIWLVIFIILFFLPLFMNRQNTASQNLVNEGYVDSIPIFESINDVRAEKGLPLLQIDERLCAYSKRRGLQYQEKVVVPPGEKFELLPLELGLEIEEAYFKDFRESNEQVLRAVFSSSDEIAETFTDQENQGAARLDLTHGCVAEVPTANGTGTWTVFIGGVRK